MDVPAIDIDAPNGVDASHLRLDERQHGVDVVNHQIHDHADVG